MGKEAIKEMPISKHKGRIIIDGITKKQAKSLCVVIEKKGLPFDD